MIAGIVLAAGSAERMGRQKLLLDLRGKSVLQWTLEAALASKLDEVICVTQALEKIEEQMPLKHGRLRWIVNERANEGQSTSVIAGLKAIPSHSEAALFLVGDQPLIQPELINSLVELFRQGGALIVVPTFQRQSRNPVLFHRDLFPELLRLTGDRGGKALIEKYRQKVVSLEWKEEASFLDLDTWKDYETLKQSH